MVDRKTARVLIIYDCQENKKLTENILFFLHNGYIDNPQYDYIFISSLKIQIYPQKSNIKIVDNMQTILSSNPIYDYYIFINSTVRGPFFPVYAKNKLTCWPDLFSSKLNDFTKLVGPIISINDIDCPTVDDSFLMTDSVGFNLIIKDGTLLANPSKIILENNYNIGCLLYKYRDIDFTKTLNIIYKDEGNPCGNPYEVIFFKGDENDQLLLERYTQWNNRKVDFSHITKILYGLHEIELVDVTELIKSYITKNGYLDNMFNINEYLGYDPCFMTAKNLYFYNEMNTIIYTIPEFDHRLCENSIFI
jgi:hypothetical protein